MLSGQAVLGGQRALCGIAMQLPPQWIFGVVLVTLLSHKFIHLTSENLRFDVFFCKKMSAPTTLGGCALLLSLQQLCGFNQFHHFFLSIRAIVALAIPDEEEPAKGAASAVLDSEAIGAVLELRVSLLDIDVAIAHVPVDFMLIVFARMNEADAAGFGRHFVKHNAVGRAVFAAVFNGSTHVKSPFSFVDMFVFVLISSHRWRAFVNRKIYVFTDLFAKSVDLVTSSVYTEGKQRGGNDAAGEENTMTTEQLIKVALSYAGMTQAELADKIGMNKSNFNARMKRESFSRIEMEQIAKALGMEFVYTFKMPDGKTI